MEQALRYNLGKPQWSLVHYESLEPMIRVLEYGAHKYSIFEDSDGKRYTGAEISQKDVELMNLKLISSGRDNWKKPMPLKKILESMQRHLAALMDGEEFDKESGLPHEGHLQCNNLFYNYHMNLKRKEVAQTNTAQLALIFEEGIKNSNFPHPGKKKENELFNHI